MEVEIEMAVTVLEYEASSENRLLLLRSGLLAALPLAIGYAPIAVAYGLLAKSVGLQLFECVAMSVIVFAGASQFIALNLVSAGVGAGEIVLATFLVNLRHFLMSASISRKLRVSSLLQRAVLAFGITDESFAVASLEKADLSREYMVGLEVLSYSSWVAGSAVGYVAGRILPEQLQTSMGIALYAMFIGLLIPAAKKSRKVFFLGAFSAALCGLFTVFLSGGWPMIAATIIASTGMALLDTKAGEQRQ